MAKKMKLAYVSYPYNTGKKVDIESLINKVYDKGMFPVISAMYNVKLPVHNYRMQEYTKKLIAICDILVISDSQHMTGEMLKELHIARTLGKDVISLERKEVKNNE